MKDNERLVRIEQKLTDFMNLYKEHRTLDAARIGLIETDMSKLKKLKAKIETPVKWVGWAATASTAGALAFLGERVGRWILHK